ncbi:hypothetical protein LQF12_04670 [Ruania suaedae]|uniref:hypothetical protein n=1 Tax=Ruania suaedae TaxID=2897774 RepID=UPI001E6551B8|nr:hypothetical protein [Ruania suaedae]UFU03907.1 hypothetical protein LQF12_04670 [Ruania suaedae]
MTTSPHGAPAQEWEPADRTWAGALELALAVRGARAETVERILGEARAAVDLAGAPAEEALGPVEEYAAEQLLEHGDDAELAEADVTAPDARSWAGWVFTSAGFMIAAFAAFTLLTDLSAPALLPLTLALAAGTAALCGSWTLLQNGHLVLAALAALTFPVVCGIGGWAVTSWSDDLPVMPPGLMLGIGVVACGGGLALVRRRTHLPPAPTDPQVWLRRLRGVLMGRYFFSPAQARAAAEEVAEHSGGRGLVAQFGHPERYAQLLARQSRRPQRRRGLVHALLWLVWGVVIAASAWRTLADDGLAPIPVLLALAAALVLGYAVHRARDSLRTDR